MIISIDGNIPSKKAHSFNIMKMAQGFLDLNEDVTLITLNSWPLIKASMKIADLYDYYSVSKNIKIKRITPWNLDFFKSTLGAKNYNTKASEYILKQNPNFVYCRGYLTPYYCIKKGLQVITEIHSVNYDHPDLKKLFSVIENDNFLGLVTIHQKIKEEYIKKGVPEDKIIVLEDAVDPERFEINDDKSYCRRKVGLDKEETYIVYSGSLYKEKGIENILLTAKIVQDKSNIKFVLVGGSSKEIIFWQNYCSKALIKNVDFTGFVSNSILPYYLKAADALIMPYSLKIKYEAMDINTTSPLKLFEYMAARRPIISTNISVIAKILDDEISGILCEPDNIEEMAEKTIGLINNKTKSDSIANASFNLSKEYSWKNRCQKIINNFIKKSRN